MSKKTKNDMPTHIALETPERVANNPRCPVSGSRRQNIKQIVVNQIAGVIGHGHADDETRRDYIVAAMGQVAGVNPQDELEGMLAAQMVACHYAAMECFKRAMLEGQTFEGRAMNLNQANKLTRSYTGLLDALNKHRGKGQQKVTVEHVHVHAGGQAIVGSVEQTGGGSHTKTEEQAHATTLSALEDRTGEGEILPPLWRKNAKRQALPVPRDA